MSSLSLSLQFVAIVLVVLDVVLATAIWMSLRTHFRHAHSWLLILVVYFVLRSIERAVDAFVQVSFWHLFVDVVLIPILLALIWGARGTAHTLVASETAAVKATEDARGVSAEYRRALHDYTILMRHRLVNPLAAITGGIETIRDVDLVLDRETRVEVLDAITLAAKRLETVILSPEIVSSEEGGLVPLPRISSSAVAAVVEADAVKAEQHFDTLNMRSVEQLAKTISLDHITTLTCECWDIDCTSTMHISLRDYLTVKRLEHQFVICPSHFLPTVEAVIEKHRNYWVIRKFPESMDQPNLSL